MLTPGIPGIPTGKPASHGFAERRELRTVEDEQMRMWQEFVNMRIQIARLTQRVWQLEHHEYPRLPDKFGHVAVSQMPTRRFQEAGE